MKQILRYTIVEWVKIRLGQIGVAWFQRDIVTFFLKINHDKLFTWIADRDKEGIAGIILKNEPSAFPRPIAMASCMGSIA